MSEDTTTLIVCRPNEPLPQKVVRSIFLAGPTPRDPAVPTWRTEAVGLLKSLGFTGHVFVPEPASGVFPDYTGQVEWEEQFLNAADCIVFWVPRDMTTMPALTTNIEWGVWSTSGKVVWGAPPAAEKVRYQQYYANKLGVPSSDTLRGILEAAIKLVGVGAERVNAEVEIPAYIWNRPHFQHWYCAQKACGNALMPGSRVLWTWMVKRSAFFFALHAKIFIAAEGRVKVNEVVIARPDISSVLLYHCPPDMKSVDDVQIVMVKEHRVAASTVDGYVWELPGGSSWEESETPLQIAEDECREETGLTVNANRLTLVGSRQLAATALAHKAHLFSVRLTDEEVQIIRDSKGKPKGVDADTERTFVELVSVKQLLSNSGPVYADWTTLGMVLAALPKN